MADELPPTGADARGTVLRLEPLRRPDELPPTGADARGTVLRLEPLRRPDGGPHVVLEGARDHLAMPLRHATQFAAFADMVRYLGDDAGSTGGEVLRIPVEDDALEHMNLAVRLLDLLELAPAGGACPVAGRLADVGWVERPGPGPASERLVPAVQFLCEYQGVAGGTLHYVVTKYGACEALAEPLRQLVRAKFLRGRLPAEIMRVFRYPRNERGEFVDGLTWARRTLLNSELCDAGLRARPGNYTTRVDFAECADACVAVAGELRGGAAGAAQSCHAQLTAMGAFLAYAGESGALGLVRAAADLLPPGDLRRTLAGAILDPPAGAGLLPVSSRVAYDRTVAAISSALTIVPEKVAEHLGAGRAEEAGALADRLAVYLFADESAVGRLADFLERHVGGPAAAGTGISAVGQAMAEGLRRAGGRNSPAGALVRAALAARAPAAEPAPARGTLERAAAAVERAKVAVDAVAAERCALSLAAEAAHHAEHAAAVRELAAAVAARELATHRAEVATYRAEVAAYLSEKEARDPPGG